MNRILFICTANICRSPMAEAIFNALAEDRSLDFRAHSAGVAALEGEPMAPYSRTALEEMGVYSREHSARQVSAEMIEEADLVLTMSPWHIARLRKDSGDNPKIQTLPQYASNTSREEGIPDPYGGPMVAYRATARQLFEFVDLLVKRLAM